MGNLSSRSMSFIRPSAGPPLCWMIVVRGYSYNVGSSNNLPHVGPQSRTLRAGITHLPDCPT